MPPRIQLGAPRISLAEGNSLFVTSPAGEIRPSKEEGFFVQDTRLLSRYRLRLGHVPWTLVSSAPVTHYSAELHLVNPEFDAPGGLIPLHDVSLRVDRTLRGGLHEDLDVANYGTRTAAFSLVIEAGCDFADLFEVRRLATRRRRAVHVGTDQRRREVQWIYEREDFRRGLVLYVPKADTAPRLETGQVTFDVSVAPRGSWHACLHLIPLIDGERIDAPDACHAMMVDELEERRQRWYRSIVGCETPNEDVRSAYRQAVDDMTVLRLTAADSTVEHCVVAAGIPWFATLFGRDSLVISLQTLPVTKRFAPAVLRELGALQATATDDWRDAQPGKILHEIRYGELAHFNAIPHTPYYGAADATILYLIALHETYRWMGDLELVRSLLPVAERALGWIDEHGDLDGDGLQEYRRRSPRGIRHQGWKDGGEAVVHEDGAGVEAPVALVELQGYVYDAWRRMAELYDALDRPDDATRLREKAASLQTRFTEQFWWPEEGTFYFALDGHKRPVRSVVSNAGHALWSGIATPEQARRATARLMAGDMFSGWGIRTLSSNHPVFNPYSYHLGSVWPHDNSLIAFGFRRYGFASEALRIAEGIVQTASYFQSYHLPELLAGLQRGPRAFPVQYLGANIPQGWAAGSVFALLQMMLGLRPDAPAGRLLIDPVLPEWLPSLRLNRLTIGRAVLNLIVTRNGGSASVDVEPLEGTVEIVRQAWTPDDV